MNYAKTKWRTYYAFLREFPAFSYVTGGDEILREILRVCILMYENVLEAGNNS